MNWMKMKMKMRRNNFMALNFEQILKILEESLDIDLHMDEHRGCRLLINDKITLQMEMDKTENFLIIGSDLFEIPPGKFRENILKAALRSNYGKEKGFGTLSYIPKKATLFLHEFIPLNFFTEDKVFEMITKFLSKALMWKESLESGQIPQSAYQNAGQSSIKPFGMR